MRLLFFLLLASVCCSQAYEGLSYNDSNGGLNYRFFKPTGFEKNKEYPLIIFLHGIGQRGSDNERQLIHGGDFFISDELQSKNPSFIVFPQCPIGAFWDYEGETSGSLFFVEKIIALIINKYPIDKQKIYIGGLSMGAWGTFSLVNRNPRFFSKAFTMCGGSPESFSKNLIYSKWRIDHGKKDRIVPYTFSEIISSAIKESGGEIELNLYEDVYHNVWDVVFSDPSFSDWLNKE